MLGHVPFVEELTRLVFKDAKTNKDVNSFCLNYDRTCDILRVMIRDS